MELSNHEIRNHITDDEKYHHADYKVDKITAQASL